METIGLQQWNQPPQRERRGSRGGQGRRRGGRNDESCERRRQSTINRFETEMPQARATRENLHTLTQLQRLYTLQLQLESARTEQVAALERQLADARGLLLQDALQVEQQILVNTHGLGPVSRERLGALSAQIAAMLQRL